MHVGTISGHCRWTAGLHRWERAEDPAADIHGEQTIPLLGAIPLLGGLTARIRACILVLHGGHKRVVVG